MRGATILVVTLLGLLAAGPAAATRFGFTHQSTISGDARGRALLAPEGVACGAAGDVIVADSGRGRLVRYRSENGRLAGGDEIKLPPRVVPVRVQLDRQGRIFVLDQRTRRVLRVGAGGREAAFVELTGAAGKPVVAAFKLDAAGNLYLLDVAAGAVLVASAGGAVQRRLPLPADAGMFSDLAVTAGGVVYALSGTASRLFMAKKGASGFAPLGKSLAAYVSYGAYLTLDRREQRLLIVDQHGNGMVVVGTDGTYQGRELSRGWREGFLYYPTQVCFTAQGELFVADRNNHRVQVFSSVR